MEYTMNTDYLSIITESASQLSPIYKEAAENADKGTNKGLAQLKNFITSIENLAKKPGVKDERISSSKGNIKSFSGYDDIKNAITFLNKNLSSLSDVKLCESLYSAMEKYSSLYEKGYSHNIRLVQLEYENGVYMLVTTLSALISTNIDVVTNGSEIKIVKKKSNTHGIIQKAMKDFTKQITDNSHKEYLEALIDASEKNINESGYNEYLRESVYMEDAASTVAITFELIKGIFVNGGRLLKNGITTLRIIKRSIFGVIPAIRCCMYIRYKKKADTIVALEEQMVFISRNIEQLKNTKNMDEARKRLIIRKQEAIVEAYRKKAEKLRAQLMETEKDASLAIAKEDPQMKDTSDDLVLESGRTIEEVFDEGFKDSNTNDALEGFKNSWEDGNAKVNAAANKMNKTKTDVLDGINKRHTELEKVLKDANTASKKSESKNAKTLKEIDDLLAGLRRR